MTWEQTEIVNHSFPFQKCLTNTGNSVPLLSGEKKWLFLRLVYVMSCLSQRPAPIYSRNDSPAYDADFFLTSLLNVSLLLKISCCSAVKLNRYPSRKSLRSLRSKSGSFAEHCDSRWGRVDWSFITSKILFSFHYNQLQISILIWQYFAFGDEARIFAVILRLHSHLTMFEPLRKDLWLAWRLSDPPHALFTINAKLKALLSMENPAFLS